MRSRFDPRGVPAAIFLALALLVGTSASLWAYTVNPNATTPYRWGFGANVEVWYYSAHTFWNQGKGWDSTLDSAASTWNATASTAFSFRRDPSGQLFKAECQAGMDNYWFNDPVGEKDGVTLAWTRKQLNSKNEYIDAEVVFSTCTISGGPYDGRRLPFYDGTQAASLPSNYYDLKSILLHEQGHVIGLCHTAKSSRAMYYSINFGDSQGLTYNDQAGKRYIYDRASITTALPEQEKCL